MELKGLRRVEGTQMLAKEDFLAVDITLLLGDVMRRCRCTAGVGVDGLGQPGECKDLAHGYSIAIE